MQSATPEQQRVIDWVVDGQGHALVSSVAGSGKSTLITQCANQIPLSQKVIILSFNKKIAEEMRSKLKARIPSRFQGEPNDWKYTQAVCMAACQANKKILYVAINESKQPRRSLTF